MKKKSYWFKLGKKRQNRYLVNARRTASFIKNRKTRRAVLGYDQNVFTSLRTKNY